MRSDTPSFLWGRALVSFGLLLSSCGSLGVAPRPPHRELRASTPLPLSYTSGGRVALSSLGFSLSLPSAQYRPLSPEELGAPPGKDVQLYGFANIAEGAYLFASVLGASFDKEGLWRYAEAWMKSEAGELVASGFSWDDAQQEASFWISDGELYRRVRIITCRLGSSQQEYVVALVGVSLSEALAYQLTEGFSVQST